MKDLLLPVVIALPLACTQPANPLTSVDGLEGGGLTSELDVPALNVAGAVRAGSLDTPSAVLGNLTVTSGIDAPNADLEIKGFTAQTVSAAQVTVSGAVEASDVTAAVVSTTELRTTSSRSLSYSLSSLSEDPLAADNGGVLGNIVGVYSVQPGEGVGNYSAADRACANAFAGSHLCGELEALRFARGTVGGIAERVLALGGVAIVDGASYATFSKAVVGLTGTNEPIVADDCEGWALSIAGTPAGTHARHVLRLQELSAGVAYTARPDTTTSCSTDDVRLLCCQ